MSPPYNSITETDLRTFGSGLPCDLKSADLSFPPVSPPRTGQWVYTQACAGGDVLPTLLVPAVTSGTDVDTVGGLPGSLRLYQLSCGCANGHHLTKQAGMVRLDLF